MHKKLRYKRNIRKKYTKHIDRKIQGGGKSYKDITSFIIRVETEISIIIREPGGEGRKAIYEYFCRPLNYGLQV